jgi:signal transduction histidine kinase
MSGVHMSVLQPNNIEPSSSLPTATILVVDDEKNIRELCLHALQKYRVVEASTYEEAIKIYQREHFDLVLSDIMMPGGSGIDLLKHIKEFDPNATVVMMTGFMDPKIILTALKEDADDFINKPLNLIQLKTTVEKALAKKALKEELADVKRSSDFKNVFMSLVSHKLRTPITGISLFLQNLRAGVFNHDDSAFQENIAMASEEMRYLGQLVTDLLAFNKVMVSSTGVHRKPCDLNEIIAEVLHKCRETHCQFEAAVDFTPGVLPALLLDASKIRFALLQVVDNAFKFSPELCQVSVVIESHDDMVFVIVSDRGIGIPEAEIGMVLEKFYQIDPELTGQVRGFGLGLFYAQTFISQHGGNIRLTSQPGSGTTVTIRLPLE